jgi:hypothetical protein
VLLRQIAGSFSHDFSISQQVANIKNETNASEKDRGVWNTYFEVLGRDYLVDWWQSESQP